jgi:hypothetical protein
VRILRDGHKAVPGGRGGAGRRRGAVGGCAQAAPLVTYVVNVTNTGSMDADDVVLGFMVPPGAGKDGEHNGLAAQLTQTRAGSTG